MNFAQIHGPVRDEDAGGAGGPDGAGGAGGVCRRDI